MFHKIILWVSVIASIVGIVLVIVEKLSKGSAKLLPSWAVYTLIVLGAGVAIVLAVTEKSSSTTEPRNVINANNNQGTQININHPENNGDINIGDLTTTAETRYNSALKLVQEEALSNFMVLKVLIEAVEEHVPEPFWDKRKPNESEDTYQERAKNFHRDYQTQIIQRILKFPIKTDVFNSRKIELDYNAAEVSNIQKAYKNQQEVIFEIQSYSDGLLHNLSLDYRDSELATNNRSMQKEKIINAKVAFLMAESDLIDACPSHIESIAGVAELFSRKFPTGSHKEAHKALWQEMAGLTKEKTAVLSERVKRPRRDGEIDRIIKDPYLQMLRKAAGLPDTLTEADAWALKHKKIHTEIAGTQELLSAAAMSYMESDGRASKYYLEKALTNNDSPEPIRLFIERSFDRVNNPDCYNGSIGLIVMQLDDDSPLKATGIKPGDILYKLNGEIVNDPTELSSLLGKTKREDNILLTLLTSNNTIRNLSVNGGTPLNCKISQLIMLNVFQL